MKSDDNELYVEFGKRLKELRTSRGYTQIELAKAVNLSQTAIVQYEAGSRKIPLKTLKIFSEFYGLTLDELIEPNNEGIYDEGEINKQPLTKYEVASEIGFTKKEISILESGVEEIPKSFFEKFANYFNVDIKNLIGLKLESDREHAVITADKVLIERYKKWKRTFGYNHFSDEEFEQIIDYAQYLVSKRGRK